ncbi:MAG: nucleotidyltransferase family protein [Calditrichota bacterium]
MITAILLAAGASRRMGPANKLMLSYEGKPMLLHTLDALIESKIERIIVVKGHQPEAVEATIKDRTVRSVCNPDWERGMTGSIQAGVGIADLGSSGYMICQADMPDILTSTYNKLYDRFFKLDSGQQILLPAFKKKRGNPVLFGRSYRQEILRHTEPEGCRALVKKNSSRVSIVEVDDPGILRDIDTPKEFQLRNKRRFS